MIDKEPQPNPRIKARPLSADVRPVAFNPDDLEPVPSDSELDEAVEQFIGCQGDEDPRSPSINNPFVGQHDHDYAVPPKRVGWSEVLNRGLMLAEARSAFVELPCHEGPPIYVRRDQVVTVRGRWLGEDVENNMTESIIRFTNAVEARVALSPADVIVRL